MNDVTLLALLEDGDVFASGLVQGEEADHIADVARTMASHLKVLALAARARDSDSYLATMREVTVDLASLDFILKVITARIQMLSEPMDSV